jgi:hypothetical protein
MAGCRRAVDLAMTAKEIETLTALARSRTEAARHVERAQMLLAYRQQRSFFAVGQRLGVHHQTVQRCVERALAYAAARPYHRRTTSTAMAVSPAAAFDSSTRSTVVSRGRSNLINASSRCQVEWGLGRRRRRSATLIPYDGQH